MAVMTEQSGDQRREMRWSANKETDVVLRLLRGETLPPHPATWTPDSEG